MKFIPRIISLPNIVFGWLAALLLTIAFVGRGLRLEHEWFISLELRDWVTRYWRYSTTLPGLILYYPGTRHNKGEDPSSTAMHEYVHVRQMQDCMAYGLVTGLLVLLLTGNIFAAYMLYSLSPTKLLLNMLVAGFRYGFNNAYMESEHERAAYSVVDTKLLRERLH